MLLLTFKPSLILNLLLLLLLNFGEALTAVDWAILAGLKGNLGFLAASGANGCEHLSLGSGIVFTGVAAGLAPLGLIYKASLGIEFLLTSSENKLIAALFALKDLVCVHFFYLAYGLIYP